MSLDNFSPHQSAREHEEHRMLIQDTTSILSKSASISSIAARGARLLTDLLAEDKAHDKDSNTRPPAAAGTSQSTESSQRRSEKSLDVAAFVKKFCESEQSQAGNSPLATSHMPLWLQQDFSSESYSNSDRAFEGDYSSNRCGLSHPASHSRSQLQESVYDFQDRNFQDPSTQRQHPAGPADSFAQAFSDAFDVRSVTWFDDLLGLAPSNSI